MFEYEIDSSLIKVNLHSKMDFNNHFGNDGYIIGGVFGDVTFCYIEEDEIVHPIFHTHHSDDMDMEEVLIETQEVLLASGLFKWVEIFI